MISPHEDPQTAQEFRLADYEAELTLCESHQRVNSAGAGGKTPSKDESHLFTKMSPTPVSTPSESSNTGDGRKARGYRPASGGNRAK